MRCSRLFPLLLSGCVGVHLGHAPAVPYPITVADLVERAPAEVDGRLPGPFAIPRLTSLAPDPVAVEFGPNRQIVRYDMLEQRVPQTLNDAFHARVGGSAGAPIPVTVVIERLYTGCYPVQMGEVRAGEYAFVEAWISFGPAGGQRARFTVKEPACGASADAILAALGDALAQETILLAKAVQ